MLRQPRGLAGRKKLQSIIDAASRIVLAQGLDQAKMSAIATAAGVSTATVYAYFPSKDDLFRAVVKKVAGNIEVELLEALHAPDGDPIEKLALAIMGRLNDPELRALFRIMGEQGRKFPDALAFFDSHSRLKAHQSAVALFERLAREGRFTHGVAEMASRQLLGMLKHETLVLGILNGTDDPGPRNAAEIAREAVKTLRARFGRDGEAL
ncbi:TetR/AcrR family transcriptional regulator [Caulobacter sp.]|uniref:TetR/AcrR family transcriptional regulator n=1 Tax=Caulobacter sp. TaxID=78 RepID=UPI001B09CC44|nr:TetR/AcrR family transcriptional regulator [Caulobacter sp.]MBO9543630.1 TetR/AcrR family transcriptional regulator [Caulobacter sp.]